MRSVSTGNAGQGAPAGDSGVTPAMTGDGGLRLTGEGSMLGELVRAVLERALEAELTAHLGYGRNERADRGGGPGNYRNGTIAKTVQTGVGPVGLAVPRDTPARPPCAVDPGGSAGGAAGPQFLGVFEIRHGTGPVALQVPHEAGAVGVAELDLLGGIHHRRGPRLLGAGGQQPRKEGLYVGGAGPVGLVGDP